MIMTPKHTVLSIEPFNTSGQPSCFRGEAACFISGTTGFRGLGSVGLFQVTEGVNWGFGLRKMVLCRIDLPSAHKAYDACRCGIKYPLGRI